MMPLYTSSASTYCSPSDRLVGICKKLVAVRGRYRQIVTVYRYSPLVGIYTTYYLINRRET